MNGNNIINLIVWYRAWIKQIKANHKQQMSFEINIKSLTLPFSSETITTTTAILYLNTQHIGAQARPIGINGNVVLLTVSGELNGCWFCTF